MLEAIRNEFVEYLDGHNSEIIVSAINGVSVEFFTIVTSNKTLIVILSNNKLQALKENCIHNNRYSDDRYTIVDTIDITDPNSNIEELFKKLLELLNQHHRPLPLWMK